MKQVLRQGFKDIVVDEVPDPALAAHHVLIRPVYSLISSGTETASIHQEGVIKGVAENPSHLRKVWEVMKATSPLKTAREVKAKFSEYVALGYSGAGIVVDKHPTVDEFEIGDRVAYGGEGTGHGETVLAGRRLVVPVPQGVPFEHACFTTLGSIALNAVRTASIGVGDVVAVIGVGLVGQLVAQMARLQGGVVVAMDLRPERVELARELGADYGLAGGEGTQEAMMALTSGRGADCVIVAAAAKSPVPCQQALGLCRDRGRIVIVGAVEINLPWEEMYRKEIQLLMSRAYGPGSYDAKYEKEGEDYPAPYVRWTEQRNMAEFIRLLEQGRINLEPLITHRFALEQAAEAYQTIMNPQSGSLAVLLRYPAADSQLTAADFTPRRRLAVKADAEEGDAERGERVIARAQRRSDRERLQVGVAGAGNLARWEHLPHLSRQPGVALRSIYSASGVRGKSYARRFGAAYCYSDFDEMIADPELDAVVIVSRNQEHARQTLAALRAGKHVFVEKPMAITEEECREICAEVERSGLKLAVGFNRRFAPFYRDLKDALAGRASPAVINCRINSPGISGAYWMADPAIGGAIVGEGCHFVDLMYWLLDEEPVSVSAYSLPTGRSAPIGENNLVASFRFENGSIGNLTYCTVGSRTSGGERVEVFCEGVGAVVEDFKMVELRTGSGRRRRSRWWAEKGYGEQMTAFLDALRTDETPQVTARDGARATIGCLLMLESARTMNPCAFDLEAALSMVPDDLGGSHLADDRGNHRVDGRDDHRADGRGNDQVAEEPHSEIRSHTARARG